MMIGPLPTLPGSSQPWSREKRLEFIDFRLAWEGRVNRSDLTSFFGISVPQASADLAEYQKLAPLNTSYDKQAKAYVVEATFEPLDKGGNPYSLLNAIRQIDAGVLPKEATFLGWMPSSSITRLPSRRIDFTILRTILHCIRTQTQLRFTYQSMNRPLPTERCVSPHAIAFDGIRWHLRAYCYEREDFRDFVLARVSCAQSQTVKGMDPSGDLCWFNELDVVIEPAPHLSDGQRRAIELDYEMIGSRLSIRTKESMLLYLLQQLPLFGNEGRLRHNQLVLANEAELQGVFQRLHIDF